MTDRSKLPLASSRPVGAKATALTGAWLLRGHRVVRNAFLLVASYYFAWRLHDHFLVVLAVSTIVNYGVARAIDRGPGWARGAWLGFGVAFNVGVLAYFKYWGFFATGLASFAGWLGLEPHLDVLTHIAVKNHANGALNPRAQFRSAVTAEAVSSAPLVAGSLRVYDCSGVADGAAEAAGTGGNGTGASGGDNT